jgi:hypothetical protein
MPRAATIAFPYWVGPGDRHRHTEYMLLSTAHWQPLVNGYSDHIPPELYADKRHFAAFPNDAAWRAMRARGVRYVLMHWNLYAEDGAVMRAAVSQQTPYLRSVVDAPDVSLYEVIAWPRGTH